jgi:hypothetical protein
MIIKLVIRIWELTPKPPLLEREGAFTTFVHRGGKDMVISPTFPEGPKGSQGNSYGGFCEQFGGFIK